jgi:23S rRNA (uracil1939-C5)-methyltransferase
MAQPAYLRWKRNRVIEALQRRNLDTDSVGDIIAVAPGDRRRADFVAVGTAQGLVLGFHRRGHHRVVDIGTCVVVSPAVNTVLAALRPLLERHLAVGATASIPVTECDNDLSVLIEWPAAENAALWQDLATFAADHDLASLAVRDPRGGEIVPVAVRRKPVVRMGGVDVPVPPGAFLQASPAAEAVLRDRVLDGVGDAKAVADLYAGCGTFSLPLAARCRVHAVEGDAELAAALRAAIDGTGGRINTTVEERDLFRRPLSAKELKNYDAVVFDPPRAGARTQAAELAASDVGRIVAVSCEPGTFARDVRTLVDGGYRLEQVVPIDQFVWSIHVEMVGVLARD